jgi:hypothetical protein
MLCRKLAEETQTDPFPDADVIGESKCLRNIGKMEASEKRRIKKPERL